MDADWTFYQRQVDNWPASMAVNREYQVGGAVAALPSFAILTLKIKHPRDNGFPTAEEFPDINAIDDRLSEVLYAEANSRYVGRKTSAGIVEFYYYTADAAVLQEKVAGVMASFPTYHLDVSTISDLTWTGYFKTLLPKTDAEKQQVSDNDVISNLVAHGDDIYASRLVDHLTYFPSRQARDAFKADLQGNGFSAFDEPFASNDEGKWVFQFSRSEAPAYISETTLGLYRLASQYGGEYDGWGCVVVLKGN